MVVIPPSPEDRFKSFFYTEVARDKKLADISEYTRTCMKRYDEDRFSSIGKRLSGGISLMETLIQIADEYRNAPSEKRESVKVEEQRRGFWKKKKLKTKHAWDIYDRKAFEMIRRCCKGFREIALEYYRFYRSLKEHEGNIPVYIDYREEDIPVADDMNL